MGSVSSLGRFRLLLFSFFIAMVLTGGVGLAAAVMAAPFADGNQELLPAVKGGYIGSSGQRIVFAEALVVKRAKDIVVAAASKDERAARREARQAKRAARKAKRRARAAQG